MSEQSPDQAVVMPLSQRGLEPEMAEREESLAEGPEEYPVRSFMIEVRDLSDEIAPMAIGIRLGLDALASGWPEEIGKRLDQDSPCSKKSTSTERTRECRTRLSWGSLSPAMTAAVSRPSAGVQSTDLVPSGTMRHPSSSGVRSWARV
jgi:hypothetical protein